MMERHHGQRAVGKEDEGVLTAEWVEIKRVELAWEGGRLEGGNC
jgi:hypothetical protein